MNPRDRVLSGRRILVTAQRRAGDLRDAFERHGALVDCAAPLGVVAQVDNDTLIAQTHRMLGDAFDVLVVTTGTGFRAWLDAAEAAGIREAMLTSLSGTRLIARGSKAQGAIRAAGLRTAWVAESETAAEITDHLRSEGVGGLRIGVQQHASGDDGLSAELGAAGAHPEELVVYRWGPPPDPDALDSSVHEAVAGSYDAAVFTSAPGAAAWLAALDAIGARDGVLAHCHTGRLTLAAVGNVTAAPLRDAGVDPLVPERARMGSLIRAVTAHLANR